MNGSTDPVLRSGGLEPYPGHAHSYETKICAYLHRHVYLYPAAVFNRKTATECHGIL